MLSDEALEKVTERVIQRLQKLNTDILKQIGSNLDEIGKLKPSQAQQLAQMLKYGGDYDKIVKELSKVSKLNTKEIKEIFEEVSKNDYRFAKQFYDYRGIGYIPYDENVALKNQVQAIANITARRCAEMMTPRALGFGLINKKTGDIEFKGLKQAYYDLLDEAVLSVSQGKESFDQAMTRQIKQMGSGGLKVIYDSTYINKEGKEVHNSRRLDSAIRMNLKDSLRELHNETQDIFGKEFSADGVEISVHENPAPDHQLVQGRQFTINKYDEKGNVIEEGEFEKFQNDKRAISYDGVVFEPEFEGHDRRSISEYNCYHYTFSIVLGVSEPEYTNEQLQEIVDRNNEGFEIDGKHYTRYEGTQMQRQLETKIREQKDIQIMARASGQDDLVRESQQKITQLTQKYRELSQKANLPTKMKRMKVSGYKRTKLDRQLPSQPKINALEFTLEQPKVKLNPINDNKFYNSSKIFKESKEHLDLTNNENINIYNGTDKLNITIYERKNIKKAFYSRQNKKIQTTGVIEGSIGPEATLWHEMGHALDNHKGGDKYLSNSLEMRTAMYDYYSKNRTVPDNVKQYFASFREKSNKEFESLNNYDDYYNNYIEIKKNQGETEWNLGVYKDRWENDREDYKRMVDIDYRMEQNLYYYNKKKTDMEYAQLLNFSDMFSAISSGEYNSQLCGGYGYHTKKYFNEKAKNPTTELFANFVSLKMTGCKGHLEFFKNECPDIYKELDELFKQIGDDLNAK